MPSRSIDAGSGTGGGGVEPLPPTMPVFLNPWTSYHATSAANMSPVPPTAPSKNELGVNPVAATVKWSGSFVPAPPPCEAQVTPYMKSPAPSNLREAGFVLAVRIPASRQFAHDDGRAADDVEAERAVEARPKEIPVVVETDVNIHDAQAVLSESDDPERSRATSRGAVIDGQQERVRAGHRREGNEGQDTQDEKLRFHTIHQW